LRYTDPSGEVVWFIPIIIGAAIGTYSGYKIGQTHGATGWSMAGYMLGGGAIGAIGGACAGYVGVAVGGAVATAGIGGFAGGAIVGGAAGAAGGFINGAGMTWLGGGSFGQGITSGFIGAGIGAGTGALLGGTIQGISTARQGNSFWTGKPLATPTPTPSNTQPASDPKPYNSSYQDPSEIQLPEKLYKYTYEHPNTWENPNTILPGRDGSAYYTTDGSLNSLNAKINLSLPKQPSFRIEISTTDPNFNFNNIQIIRTVNGNVFNSGGGAWEILYNAPYSPSHSYQWNIIEILRIP
jgi:hypothetical protein